MCVLACAHPCRNPVISNKFSVNLKPPWKIWLIKKNQIPQIKNSIRLMVLLVFKIGPPGYLPGAGRDLTVLE